MNVKADDPDRPLFMIGAVARMVEVHPQTLRLYERLRLIHPKRSKGRVRLYSPRDVERLRLIQTLTRDRGVNLAGVEMILEMRRELDQLKSEMRETMDLLQKRFFQEPQARRASSPHPGPPGIRIKIERG
jgi:MerR family transcriptional regulator/heat shock protein HspR